MAHQTNMVPKINVFYVFEEVIMMIVIIFYWNYWKGAINTIKVILRKSYKSKPK